MEWKFDFATAGSIHFGCGRIEGIADLLARVDGPVLVVHGKSAEPASQLTRRLDAAGVAWEPYPISGEPTVDTAEKGAEAARKLGAGQVAAVGGGSVMDAGKAIAALAANPGPASDYLEVVGKNLPLKCRPLPITAIPTTAGTGSEVTRNAVLGVPEGRVKVSLRSPWLLPQAAVVDPTLTLSVPPAVTAATGMDALTQVLEPALSLRANPMTDLFCEEGLRAGCDALLAAYENGQNLEARTKMAWVSLLGGLALANAGLGAVHGLAGPIGGMCAAGHGEICAALLAAVTRVNLRGATAGRGSPELVRKFEQVGQWLTGSERASAEDGVRKLQAMREALHIRGLTALGVRRGDFETIVEKAQAASSMRANPIVLRPEELMEILEEGSES